MAAEPPYRWPAAPPPAAPPPPAPPVPPSAEIRVGENGRIHGVDGMLDQIAAALMRHAGPAVRRDVLPAIREDRELQARVGSVVGDAIAKELRPYLLIGAGALVVIAGVQLGLAHRRRREGRST